MLTFGRRNDEQNTGVAENASNSVITASIKVLHGIDSNCNQDKKYSLEIIVSHYVDHVFEDFQPKCCRISYFPHTFIASHLVYLTTLITLR
jgi:hypothetical protein